LNKKRKITNILLEDFGFETNINENELKARMKQGGNLIDKMKDMWSFIKGNRKQFNSTGRQILLKYGNSKIKQILICREPITKYIYWLMNILSVGQIQRKLKQLNYDDIYHLFLIIILENGVILRLEKNQIPELKIVNSIPSVQKYPISVNNLSLIELIAGGMKRQGDSFWSYNKQNNNCQKFVIDLLQGSGLISGEIVKFVLQDAKAIVAQLPSSFNKYSDILINLINRGDILIHGRGIKRRK
jgi:hypothetical protein